MRRRRILSTLTPAMLLLAGVTRADTTSTVVLGGTVPATARASVEETEEASRLNLTSAGPTIVRVSTVPVSTNEARGLTLSVRSGYLSGDGGTPVAYQVAVVPAGSLVPAPAVFTTAPGATCTVGTLSMGSSRSDIYIRYHPADRPAANRYAGWIELTLSDD